jgi:hypothetical protein
VNAVLWCLSALLVLGWLPIFLQFLKNWRGRGNPISLAICFVVAFAIYLGLVPLLGAATDPESAALAIQVANAVTCGFFHAANGWSKRKWVPNETGSGRGRRTDYPAT